MIGQDWLAEHGLWVAAAAALAMTIGAGLADWGRQRRRNLDSPGWIPWRGVQVASLFAAAALAFLAIRG